MQQRTGFQQWAADGLEGLAGIIAAQGQGGAAAHLLAAGGALRKKNAFPRWGLQQARYVEDVANARRLLAERQWQHDWAEGEAMDLGDEIGFALESCSSR